MKKKDTLKKVVTFFVLLALVLVIIYSGFQILESTVFFAEDEADGGVRKTIVRNDVEYFPRQDITVMMVLGIDQFGPVESSNYYRNTGSADTIMLLVFDDSSKECTVLNINRDTMLVMDVLGVRGEYAGTTYGHVALAHTYGTGLEDSCENVKNTLMNFLHGMSVDYYIAMNMDAIPIFNDAVGGVAVTVKDDFSAVNPTITKGEMKLMGNQVVDFLRARKDVGDQLNVTRMERQKEYIGGFLHALQNRDKENLKFVVDLYEDVSPYVITDCSVETMSNLLDRYADYTIAEVIIPEGENKIVGENYEFHVDEEKLDEMIVRIFYRPKSWLDFLN